MTLWRLSFLIQADYAQFFSESLEEYALATTCFEDPETEGTENPLWIVEAVTNTMDLHEAITTFIASLANNMSLSAPTISIDPIPEIDWLEATWRSFPPRVIGRYYVYGTHNTEEVPSDKIGIKINAATAFGSGEHETTTGCLTALDKMATSGKTFSHPLDMGCGSGILGIATAKTWNIPVLAADNDPESVRVTALNAIQNDCDEFIQAVVSEGFQSENVTSQGPFDLITANILAKPLIQMAPDMVKSLAADGIIVLSGLLIRQQEEVTNAYTAQGLKLADVITINDWATLVFRV